MWRCSIKERDLLNWVIACAEQCGWTAHHVPAPMTATRDGKFVGSRRAKGLPDLFLLNDDPPRLVIAEVKGTGGKLSDAQREFLRAAKKVADVSGTKPEWNTGIPGLGSKLGGESNYVLGVYAWTPDDIPIIESILKSKTLL